MKRFIFVLLPLLLCNAACQAQTPKVRPAAVAGSFYPADPKELAQTVDGFLAQAGALEIKDLVAVIAPHAGYIYSGSVAAHSYALLKGRKISRVVVIAPSHQESFGFSSIYDGDAFTTPLGQVPIDRAFAAGLVKASSLIRFSIRGHSVSKDRPEHSVEVELPFLQRVLGKFTLVPIVMGDQSYEACRALGLALAKSIQGTDTLIVVSSDLSHYHPYDDAVKLDRKTLRAIEEWDYLSMSQNFETNTWEACGGGPIIAAMIAAERLGARQARVLKYANSGDTTNDRTRVVGYGAVAIYKDAGKSASAAPAFTLGEAEKARLLSIARQSVESAVKQKKLLADPDLKPEALAQERGAFVTLKENGELRGCIGYSSPIKPLALAVRDVAASAAVEDTRFTPVTAAELGRLSYEISVLSPLRRVLDLNSIQVGRDGLLVRRGGNAGLFLPQVAPEQGWDRMTLIRQACVKAGLSPEAWKDPETDIFSFTGFVFSEAGAAPKPGTPRK